MQLLFSIVLGTAIGIAFAIPLGPISLFVAQQTMNGQTRKGIRVAAGSTIIDVLYCLIILLGFISLISPFLENRFVQFGLSVLMILYGIKMLTFDRRRPRQVKEPLPRKRLAGEGNMHYLLGTSMALANPTLFLSWTAMLSFLSAHQLLSTFFWDKVVFSFAVGLGNLAWFFGLAVFVRSRRHSLSPVFVRRVGEITAIVIIGFGVYFGVTIIQHLTSA
jgi:threonine/homoserine/homoserine lactone efflux protein